MNNSEMERSSKIEYVYLMIVAFIFLGVQYIIVFRRPNIIIILGLYAVISLLFYFKNVIKKRIKEKKKIMFRQGDLVIKKVGRIPDKATKKNGNIILEGEATGHAHRINFGSVYDYNGSLYLDATDTATITHEEHGTIPLEEGKYKVVRQREAESRGGSLENWNYVRD